MPCWTRCRGERPPWSARTVGAFGSSSRAPAPGWSSIRSREPCADAVRRLIHDRRLAEQCRANGLAAVEHRFTWEGAFAQLEFALDGVVEA